LSTGAGAWCVGVASLLCVKSGGLVSYLVLARKYRPRTFADLVGQEHVARTLSNAIGLDRVHHAFLFTGARGVGKTSAARILAMALSCEKGPTAEPCGVCDQCREIKSGQSVDVMEIDGASNTGVDDVRQLREGVNYAPARAPKKVYIIDEVHMLSTSAFNALLKTLEEPPEHVVFILATTEVHKIPATIMSRVQRYDFKLIPAIPLAQHLESILKKESIQFESEAVRVIARQAGGSVRDALSLLDQVIAFVGTETLSAEEVTRVLGLASKRVLVEITRAAIGRDPGAALKAFASAIDRGMDLTQIARSLQSFLHDVELAGVLSAETAPDVVDLTADEITEARDLYASAPAGLFSALFDRWSRALDDGQRAAAPRLVYEMALVDLCLTEPLLPLGDLIGKLEALESKIAAGVNVESGGALGLAKPGKEPRPAERPAATQPSAKPSASERPQPPRAEPADARSSAVPESPTYAEAKSAASQQGKRAPERPGVSTENAGAFFRALKDHLVGQSPMIAASLEHAAVESLSDSELVIVLPERFQLDQLEKARSRVEAAVADKAGRPLRVTFRQGRGSASIVKPQSAVDEQQKQAEKTKREQEARRHPMIQKAQDLFGARIQRIRTRAP